MHNSIIILEERYSFPTLMKGKYMCNSLMLLSHANHTKNVSVLKHHTRSNLYVFESETRSYIFF